MHIITGGAGFLGSALLWRLNQAGVDDILVVDDLGHGEKWKNLLARRYADYMHRDKFIRLVRQGGPAPWPVESVTHFGACSSTTETDAEFLMSNNFHYSRDVCLWAMEHGARYIQASSAATYGDGSQGFDDDAASLDALRPLNMYGYTKHLFDLWAARQKILGCIVSLKFFNVYGPNEYHKGNMRSVVCKAHAEIRATGKLRLFRSCRSDCPDGGQSRDFVYVKDAAMITTWLLQHPEVKGIYNVGTGRARTWNELARSVFTAMDLPERVEYVDMPDHLRGKYQDYTCARMDRLLAAGCPPCGVGLEEGVADYVRGYLEPARCL